MTLEHHELEMAAGVGLRRQLAAIRANRPDRHGCKPEHRWDVHVEGACGEMAVAKFLGRYWSGSVDTFRSIPDLGEFEVRTRSEDWHDLIIRRDDDAGKVYVLVTGRAPNLWVRGFLRGHEAQRDVWWQQHGKREPAWFAPHDALHRNWPSV